MKVSKIQSIFFLLQTQIFIHSNSSVKFFVSLLMCWCVLFRNISYEKKTNRTRLTQSHTFTLNTGNVHSIENIYTVYFNFNSIRWTGIIVHLHCDQVYLCSLCYYNSSSSFLLLSYASFWFSETVSTFYFTVCPVVWCFLCQFCFNRSVDTSNPFFIYQFVRPLNPLVWRSVWLERK